MKENIKILYLEDDTYDYELVRATLDDSGLLTEIIHVDTQKSFERLLEEQDFDLVLSDYNLPGFDGLKALDMVCTIQPQTPFIFLSGVMGEDLAVDSLRQGAADYVMKQHMERLAPAIRRAIHATIERKKRKDAEKELQLKNEQLQVTIEELEAINDEFLTQNEELIASRNELNKKKEQIKTSLIEKESLIKEIHHRVKNNMQIISSLLDLQAENITNENDREPFIDSQNRVRAMALVHERLYHSPDLSSIDFNDYISGLIREYTNTLGRSAETISIIIRVENIYLNIDYAIPCALIINELLTNAYKHAFPGKTEGEITIDFNRESDSRYVLTVSDNGAGLPDNFDYKNSKTLGLKLVYALINQLKGSVSIKSENGASFSIVFGTGKTVPSSASSSNIHDFSKAPAPVSILIVEDERITAMHLKKTIESAGFRVTDIAASSAEVFKSLEKETPNIILMDIILEDNSDGIEIAEQITPKYNIPIIFSTANSDKQIFERAMKISPAGYIRKPIDKTKLLYAIKHAVNLLTE
ncbi:MAG: response regulator [bacterium]|nr:response regulator [bacterium]